MRLKLKSIRSDRELDRALERIGELWGAKRVMHSDIADLRERMSGSRFTWECGNGPLSRSEDAESFLPK